jgi:hypothetical protein
MLLSLTCPKITLSQLGFGLQLVLEFFGVSAFLPYAMLIMRGMYPIGSPGLPKAAPKGTTPGSPTIKVGWWQRPTGWLSLELGCGGKAPALLSLELGLPVPVLVRTTAAAVT